MTISVRLPPRVEQKLAEYCASHKLTKSEAVKRALEQMLKDGSDSSPYEAGREFFDRNLAATPSEDVARHTKRLLRERFRGSRPTRRSTFFRGSVKAD